MLVERNSFIYISIVLAILVPWIFNFTKSISNVENLRHIVNHELKAVVPILLRFNNEFFILPDLIQASQVQIDEELRALGVRNLEFVLLDKIQGGNSSTRYMMDPILHHENSLGISSDSLQAAIFYTLESIHSNDLPFFIAQTVLYHFLNADVEVFSKSEYENFREDLEFEIGFGEAIHEERRSEIISVLRSLSLTVRPISRLRWTIDNNKLTNGNDDDVVINFPGKLSKTVKNDSHTTFKIQTILEDQLDLPQRPRNNLQIRLLAAYRKKTFSNMNLILDKLSVIEGHGELETQLKELIAELSKSQKTSWLDYLETTQNMLKSLDK